MPNNFLEWIAETPFLLSFLLLFVPAIFFSTVGILLVRVLYPAEARITGTAAHAKMGYMAEIYAVLIGMFLVFAFEDYQNMQTSVKVEALALRELHQVVAQFPPREGVAISQLVNDYTRRVIEVEWNLMRFGDEDPIAQKDLDLIFSEIAEAGKESTAAWSVAAQAQQLIREVLTQRAARLTNGPGATNELPVMFSNVIIILTLVAIALPWFVYTPYAIIHILLAAAMITVFLAVIILSVKMLYPFAGELTIPAKDFSDALQMMTVAPTPGSAP